MADVEHADGAPVVDDELVALAGGTEHRRGTRVGDHRVGERQKDVERQRAVDCHPVCSAVHEQSRRGAFKLRIRK